MDSNKLCGPNSLQLLCHWRTTTTQPSDGGKEESGLLSTGGTSPLVKKNVDGSIASTIPRLFLSFSSRHSHSTRQDSHFYFYFSKGKGKRKCLERINKSIKGVNSRPLRFKKKTLWENAEPLPPLLGIVPLQPKKKRLRC